VQVSVVRVPLDLVSASSLLNAYDKASAMLLEANLAPKDKFFLQLLGKYMICVLSVATSGFVSFVLKKMKSYGNVNFPPCL